ncbi:hypothetical protein LXA43DRAFT_997986 [Ganoderma leucocontextum]|nr:hypothetical protein LXA43DRAFT_997986 [Ganoderma leucocontextum]
MILVSMYAFPLAVIDPATAVPYVYGVGTMRALLFGDQPFTEAIIRRPDDAGDSTAWRGPGVERRGETLNRENGSIAGLACNTHVSAWPSNFLDLPPSASASAKRRKCRPTTRQP